MKSTKRLRGNFSPPIAERQKGLTTMTTSFLNTKFRINDHTRISVSSWQDSQARFAVAIERLVAGKWTLDYSTAVEGYRANEVGARYISNEVVTATYQSETGQDLPPRFFRDHHMVTGRRPKTS